MKRILFVLAVLLSAAFAQPLQARPFSKIIAFGDSLSDVGNVAGVSVDGRSPRIDGYYKQTHFCDNVIWIERLAKFWGLPQPKPGRGDTTSLKPLPNGASWAWGGAEAATGTDQPEGVTEPIPNLVTQVNTYLKVNKPDRDTLFVIWAGADNLLIGGQFGPVAAAEAVDAVTRSMRKLARAGARHIVVLNLPNLGLTPYAQSSGTVVIEAATLYSRLFNRFLDRGLAKLESDPRFRAKVYFVNAFKAVETIYRTVTRKGFYMPDFFVPGPPVVIRNVTAEALDVFDETGKFPKTYLFWDSVHPTTQGQQIVAGEVLQALN